MKRSVLVTGCNGFAGRHLTEHLRTEGDLVIGIDLEPRPWADWLVYEPMDITDTEAVLACVQQRGIEAVYHLAAAANPRTVQGDPLNGVRTNVLGCCALFEACRKTPTTTVLVAGSSEQYARTLAESLTETADQDASTFYGTTKQCAELIGRSYVRHYGCRIIFTRSFNHTGPGQTTAYVLSDFAKQCGEISAGLRQPEIRVGNIDIRRDFLDVADVVRAYRLLVEKGVPGEAYNVSSPESHSLRELLLTLLSFTGRSDIRIIVDDARLRPDEPAIIHGDSRRLRERTGWAPTVPIHETLRRLYGYWCGEVRKR